MRQPLADIGDLVTLVGPHQVDFLAFFQFAVEDADIDDDAAVIVVDAVEDEGAGGGVGKTLGGGVFAEFGDEFVDALAGFGADQDRVVGVEAEDAARFPRRLPRRRAGGRSILLMTGMISRPISRAT